MLEERAAFVVGAVSSLSGCFSSWSRELVCEKVGVLSVEQLGAKYDPSVSEP